MKNNNLRKNFIWNTIGTTLNAFSSFFLLVIVTRVNDINEAGIFTFGYSIALLLQYIGLYYGRVYQVANDKFSNFDFLITKIILCFIMMLSSIFLLLIRNYSFEKNLIILSLCLFKMIESYFDNGYAIFQKNENIYLSGQSMILKSILGMLVFFLVDIITKNVVFSIFSLIIVNLLIYFLFDHKKLKNKIIKSKINKNIIITIFKDGFSPFLILFLTLFLVNEAKYIIDFLKINDNYQTIFGIILMPATVVVLMVQYMVQPYITTIKSTFEKKDMDKFKEILFKMIFITFVIGIIVIIFAYLLGIPVLQLVYGINLDNQKNNLIIILLGAIFYGTATILSNALIAIHQNWIQVIILFLISIITIALSMFLIKNYILLGASCSYFISMFILSLLLFIVTIYIFRKENLK